MEWPVIQSNNAEAEISAADYPNLRLFTVKRAVSEVPVTDITTEGWQLCTSKTIKNFSAVAYYFGREILKNKKVPVGLIHTSWGGTPAEAWTSKLSLKDHPDYAGSILAMENRLKTQQGKEPYSFEKWLNFVQKKMTKV